MRYVHRAMTGDRRKAGRCLRCWVRRETDQKRAGNRLQ